jgi:hypothetical protein
VNGRLTAPSATPRRRAGDTAHHALCSTTSAGRSDPTSTISPNAKHALYAMVCEKVNPAG